MNKITLIFLIYFLLFPINVKAQVNLDSLFSIWNDTSQPDTIRLNAIQSIAWDSYRFNNPDSAYYFAQLQYNLAETTGHKRWMAKALDTQGSTFKTKGEHTEALEYFSRSLAISKDIGDREGVSASTNNIATIYERQGDLTKALEFVFQSLKISEELKDVKTIGSLLANIGIIYRKQGDLDQALEYLNRGRKTSEEVGDFLRVVNAQNAIGAIYLEQGEYPEALEIFSKNLAFFEKAGNRPSSAGTLANIASVYLQQGDVAKAIDNFKKSLTVFEEMGIKPAVAGISQNLGSIYFEQGDYQAALASFTKSLKISEEGGNKEDIANSMNVLGQIHAAQGDHIKALSYETKALALSQEMGNMISIKEAAKNLVISYKATGKYKQALEMTDLFVQVRDSLKSEENQKAIIQQQVQSDYEKQKAIDDLENEKRVAIETQKKENQQKLSLAIAGILLLALLLALGLWNRNRYIKKTSAALAIAKDRAEQSEKYKEQFLANMSHEIRTPMHAISGMVKILERNEHPPAQDVFLKAMQTSSDNLVVILNDVLDLSKIEAGKLDIESVPMKPVTVLENVTQILKYKAEEKGLALNYNVESDVPELVMGDPNRLNQILINLVGNAIKFTEKGNVDISLSKEGDHLKFSIHDTGIGISKDKLESIFEAFEQAKGTNGRNYRGTGLGLSISKRLTQLQNGKIWVESEEGQGSTFYVELPIVAAAADAIGQDLITEEKLNVMAASLKGIRILLAEDNDFNQMIAQDDLSFYIKDVKIDTVENGTLALEKFKTGEYDLILMDVQMPEMNGFEATEQIRELEKSAGKEKAIPIIAMTASLLKTEIDHCYESGMDNYIPKPYQPEELIGTIFKSLRAKLLI